MIWHIIDRFFIHFTAATALVLMVATALRATSRHIKNDWMPRLMHETLVTAALIVFAVSTMREAWDVANGQSLVKVATDYVSWLLGTGFGAWGLHRWHYFTWEER